MIPSASALRERRRIVGRLLAEVGRQRLLGHRDIAEALDRLALEIEHAEDEGPTRPPTEDPPDVA